MKQNILPEVKSKVVDDKLKITFSFPVTHIDVQYQYPTFGDILGTYGDYVIKAIQVRMQKCLDAFSKNMGNLIYVDGPYFVGYREANGHLGKFGFMSYDLMGQTIENIRCCNWDAISNNPAACDQIVKALLNFHEEVKECETIPLTDLHSALMEVVVCGQRPGEYKLEA